MTWFLVLMLQLYGLYGNFFGLILTLNRLAQRIVRGDVPEPLLNRKVVILGCLTKISWLDHNVIFWRAFC